MIDAQRLHEIIPLEVRLRVVEPHIYSLHAPGENTNAYDRMGSIYDTVACNRWYNRLVWGYWISEYHSLCLRALGSSDDGWVLDAGCGSLAFTANAYLSYSARPVVCVDQSIKLLMMAKAKLVKLNGAVPDNMVFLHGDVLQLPFEPRSFSTIISLNVLHCIEDVKKALQELRNVRADAGTMFLTTLIRNHRLADNYLNMLGKTGALIPRTEDQLVAFFRELDLRVTCRVSGNLAFLSCG